MHTTIRLMEWALLLAGGLWLPMCGSDNDDNTNNNAGGPAASYGGTSSATGGSGGATAGGEGGAANTGGSPTTAPTITIQNLAYIPNAITVSPGATVTVMNMDAVQHSVTSESAMGNFTLGAVNGVQFDTGLINGGATATFTIPASAPAGTVVPYFCTVHLSTMPQGTVTIQ